MKLHTLLSDEANKVLNYAWEISKEIGVSPLTPEAVTLSACLLGYLKEIPKEEVANLKVATAKKYAEEKSTDILPNLAQALSKLSEVAFRTGITTRVEHLIGAIFVLCPMPTILSVGVIRACSHYGSEFEALSGGGPARDEMFMNVVTFPLQEILIHISDYVPDPDLQKEVIASIATRHVVIVGKQGTGRTSLAISALSKIKSRKTVVFDKIALSRFVRNRGDTEVKLCELFDGLRVGPKILLMNDFHYIDEATLQVSNSILRIADVLNYAFEQHPVLPLAIITTPEHWASIAPHMNPLAYSIVRVEEPDTEAALKIMRGCLQKMHQTYGFTIEADLEEILVSLGKRYYGNLPGSALALLKNTLDTLGVDEKGHKEPLNHKTWLTKQAIYERVSKHADVPMGEIGRNEKKVLLDLEETLRKQIKAQDEAIETVSQCIRRNRAGFGEPNKPMGSFLFLGPTGVGKTALARALADELFTGKFFRIDMSEYSEHHSVSRLIGSPPGYIGYQEGGQLINTIRRTPYCLVLLDEIEKAHPNVWNIFLQVFEEGHITDGRGTRADTSNVIFIMTSNVGGRDMSDETPLVGLRKQEKVTDDDIDRIAEKELKQTFPPELLNRMDAKIIFKPLPEKVFSDIAGKFLERLAERAGSKIKITWSEDVPGLVAKKGYSRTEGARPMRRIVQDEIENLIVTRRLEGANQAHIMTEDETFLVEESS